VEIHFSAPVCLGIESGKVFANLASMVKHRRENNARVRWLTIKEETELRNVIKEKFPQHLPEFDIALNTGLRLGEVYNLNWEDVDLQTRIVTVRLSKNGETRHVALDALALAAFEILRKTKKSSGPVFLNQRSECLTGPRYWSESAVEKAGIENFTWHCLRHTFASRFVIAGVDLRTVQELLGHKSIQMTC
jgi:integrase